MRRIPLLILGDSPDLPSGLARISRDLAIRLCSIPELDVAYLGLGGVGIRETPYRLFTIQEGTYAMWGQKSLGPAWKDHAKDRQGILFSVWDPMRVSHIGLPKLFAPDGLRDLIESKRFKTWGYFPLDAHGPGLRYSSLVTDIMKGYDRRLYYTRWARQLAGNSGLDGDWIPHGIDETWQPYDPEVGRSQILKVPKDCFLLGAVATNQARKDWGLTFAAAAHLRNVLKLDVMLWVHTDIQRKQDGWDFDALTVDLGLRGRVILTRHLPDQQLALCYSACDVTFANGMGEGFGYPIAESLACGTPVVHVNYGGGAELLPQEMLVTPVAYRLSGVLNDVRPVLAERDVATKLVEASKAKSPSLRGLVEHLRWNKLWPVWKRWFYLGMEEAYGYSSNHSDVEPVKSD